VGLSLQGEALYVHEIFPSFQGEGILAGVPQVFLRLSGCNLRCSYCDTPRSRERTRTCRIEDWEGKRRELPNPLRAAEILEEVSALWDEAMHSVSVTGGEPLLQAEGLSALLPLFKERGMGVYLETNGTLHDRLGMLLPMTDHIAMDVKLPSTQGGKDLLEEHRLFLRLARYGNVFLKMVIDRHTTREELERACRVLGEEAGDAVLVLQPATPPRGRKRVSSRRVMELYGVAGEYFSEVRVIPQMHRQWGVR
jgi:organic radical activating enzyme